MLFTYLTEKNKESKIRCSIFCTSVVSFYYICIRLFSKANFNLRQEMRTFFFVGLMMVIGCVLMTACSNKHKLGGASRTTPLSSDAWNASEWISVVDAPVVTGKVTDDKNNRSADGANWFVSTVRNEKKVTKALWMTTGLGVYYLYVNGVPVGNEILKPGFTHHKKTKRSFTYDITRLLNQKANAENVLSAQVTPGWWADKIITNSGHEGMIGRKCAFRGVLELTYSDGSVKRYGTNQGSWKAGIAGTVRHAGIFDGEEYDAREPMGYENMGKFSSPEINTEFGGEILPSDGAEVYLRKDLTLKPVKAYKWKGVTGSSQEEYGKVVVVKDYALGDEMSISPEETLVIDFGQNCSAVPSFVFKAKEGTVLTCLPAELLNDGNGAKSRGMDGPEGSVHRLNLRIPDSGIRVVYTFANDKDYVTYQPLCSFFGYRYISISATDEVAIKSVSSVPISSITKEMETGHITTGNEIINKLISNTYWGQLSNYLSVPTDCPQRNERLGWTADTQVFTETGTFFANTDKFFHKWMRDMRDTQNEKGGFPGVAPLAQYGDEKMRVGWADAGIIVPWTIWKQYGDTRIIEDNWNAMVRFMNHVYETKYDHDALKEENGNYQWADWLSYEPLESCSGKAWDKDGLLPDARVYWNFLCASYWAIDARMMCDMAAATGKATATYRMMADEAIGYLREQFINTDGTFKTAILNTMQTPMLFALKNKLVEGEAKEKMKARLRENFASHGNCLQTGFLGTSILMETLTENGMSDIAYELLFQHKNPSWLYSIDNGATTIWERWNSYMKDVGMGPRGMNSFNHYAYGCVCQWLWESVAGIAADTKKPGFKHIIMRPIPDKRLGHVTAEYHSAAGLIKSAWHYEGDLWTWEFTIPKGATASVCLPGQTEWKEYESGTFTVTCP
jgi:alpha-L-rhamnosidase